MGCLIVWIKKGSILTSEEGGQALKKAANDNLKKFGLRYFKFDKDGNRDLAGRIRIVGPITGKAKGKGAGTHKPKSKPNAKNKKAKRRLIERLISAEAELAAACESDTPN